MTRDINDDIENQDQWIEYVKTNLDEAMCTPSTTDDTSKELKDKGAKFLSMDNADQKKQKAKEEGQSVIEDMDLMIDKSNHLVDLTIVLKGPFGSLMDNDIVQEALFRRL